MFPTSSRPARFALLAFALLFTGCDSADEPGSGGGSVTCADGSMTATTDGAAFAAECVTFQIDSGTLSLGGLTNPDGDDGATQRQITLVVPNAAVGSAASPIGFIGTYTDGELAGSTFTGTSTTGLSGTLTLSEFSDDRAVGTFSFSGGEIELSAGAGTAGTGTPTGRTVAVTNGSFDVRR